MLPLKWHSQIFLIDGLGAITSCLLLGLVLPKLNTGLPSHVLMVLSLAALCFSIYSLSCYFLKKNYKGIFLKIILLANLLYTAATIAVLTHFYAQISFIGFLYFFTEIVLVLLVCWVEIKILKLK